MAKDDELFGVRTVSDGGMTLSGITPNDIGLLDAVDLPIIVINRDCRIARINRAATTVLGLTASDVGSSLHNTIAGIENLDWVCAQVMADGAVCRRETRDGDRCFLLRIAPYTGSDRQILGAVLTFTNVTAFRASIDQAIYEREYTKAILNTVIDPLVVLDAKLQVQTANRAFYALFGLSRDETQGISIRKFGNHEWETSEVWKSIEATLADDAQFQATKIDREFPAIGRRTVVLDARRLEREGDALILLTFQDVTEQKQAERTTALLAAIVDNSDDAIISKKLDGTITSWNMSAERLFGYAAEEAMGQHITLIIPWERRSEEEDIIRRLAGGERVDHFETVRRRRDGSTVDVSLTISPVRDAAGRVIGASKVARDISERRRAERTLSEQGRLLDLSNDAIFVRDAADRVTYWNSAATELYGFTREEALGRVTHELLHTQFPAQPDKINEQLHRDERWSGELVHTTKEGTKVIVNSRWVLDRPGNGNPWRVLETNNDITQQKRTEQALRESEEKYRKLAQTLDAEVRVRTRELEERNADVLRQSGHVRELSWQLLHTQDEERRHIARELHDSAGQTLTVLGMSLAQVIQKAGRNAPDVAAHMEQILEMVQQLHREIRTTSYLLHPPLLDENGLSSAIGWYVQGLLERSDLEVRLDISEEFGRLPRDMELAIFRLVQECLTNIHRHSESKSASIRMARESDWLTVDIQDQGKGMSAARLAEIQSGRSGVGIRGMRERLGQFEGTMNIESGSSGTRVFATIPVPKAPSPEDQTKPEPSQAAV